MIVVDFPNFVQLVLNITWRMATINGGGGRWKWCKAQTNKQFLRETFRKMKSECFGSAQLPRWYVLWHVNVMTHLNEWSTANTETHSLSRLLANFIFLYFSLCELMLLLHISHNFFLFSFVWMKFFVLHFLVCCACAPCVCNVLAFGNVHNDWLHTHTHNLIAYNFSDSIFSFNRRTLESFFFNQFQVEALFVVRLIVYDWSSPRMNYWFLCSLSFHFFFLFCCCDVHLTTAIRFRQIAFF